jgi:hypothetical protein
MGEVVTEQALRHLICTLMRSDARCFKYPCMPMRIRGRHGRWLLSSLASLASRQARSKLKWRQPLTDSINVIEKPVQFSIGGWNWPTIFEPKHCRKAIWVGRSKVELACNNAGRRNLQPVIGQIGQRRADLRRKCEVLSCSQMTSGVPFGVGIVWFERACII